MNDYPPGGATATPPASGRRPRRFARPLLASVLALSAALLMGPATAAAAARQASGARPAGARAAGAKAAGARAAGAATIGTRRITAARTRPAGTARAGSTRPPRFFADIPVWSLGDSARLEVRDSSSGKLVWRARSYFTSETGVAALAGDRSFVIAKLTGSVSSCATRFYRFRLSPAGTPGRLTPLAVPALHGVVAAMTVSANGAVVAYAMSGCSGKGTRGWLGVLDTRTGHGRRWSGVNVAGESSGSVALGGPLSLSAAGRLLAFTGDDVSPSGRVIRQVARVLWTTAPAGTLARRSRVVLSGPVSGPALAAAVLSPGGGTFYACAVRLSPASKPTREADRISAYATATGRLRRTLAELTASNVRAASPVSCPLALTASGRYLLAPYDVQYPRSLTGSTVVRAARLALSGGRVRVLRMVFPHTGPPDQSGILGMYVAW